MKKEPFSLNNPKLYLGLQIDQDLSKAIKMITPNLYHYYTNEPEYLTEVEFSDQKYLAKEIGETVNFDDLRLIETNLLSLLQKMLPAYPFQSETFLLFSKQ